MDFAKYIGIHPHFCKPFFMSCYRLFLDEIPSFGKRSLILTKLQRSQKWPPWSSKHILFIQIQFFCGLTHWTDVFFCKQTHSFWSSIASRALCRKKCIKGVATLYYISPSKQQRNIVQLCTSEQDAEEHAPEDYVVEDHVVTSIMLKAKTRWRWMITLGMLMCLCEFGFCHLTIPPNL